MTQACAYWRGEIGAHVVGALDEHAAVLVVEHIAVCADCRGEYDELVPVRDWLSRLSARQAAAVMPRQASPPAGPPGCTQPQVF